MSLNNYQCLINIMLTAPGTDLKGGLNICILVYCWISI